MTSLLDELRGAPTCKVCAFVQSQSNWDEWNVALALPVTDVRNAAVVEAMRRRHTNVDEASVRRHRKNHAVR